MQKRNLPVWPEQENVFVKSNIVLIVKASSSAQEIICYAITRSVRQTAFFAAALQGRKSIIYTICKELD